MGLVSTPPVGQNKGSAGPVHPPRGVTPREQARQASLLLEETIVSVRIRMKKMGRTHRSFFRICATDKRSPRDGRVLEELGTYDPSIPDTDARAILKRDRIDYWLSVGAQPSGNVSVLIKKYGTAGSHLEVQKAALEKMAQPKVIPDPGKPASMPQPPESEASEEQTEPAPTAEAK